jgi:hypothetical protein
MKLSPSDSPFPTFTSEKLPSVDICGVGRHLSNGKILSRAKTSSKAPHSLCPAPTATVSFPIARGDRNLRINRTSFLGSLSLSNCTTNDLYFFLRLLGAEPRQPRPPHQPRYPDSPSKIKPQPHNAPASNAHPHLQNHQMSNP